MKNILEDIKIYGSMILIGALLLYITTAIFVPDLTLKIFRYQPYTVITESMEPVMNVNDVIIVKNFNLDEAKVGDVITFRADIDYNGTEEIITHYIYSINTIEDETVIRTHRHFENDSQIVPDTWLISPNQVIGTYAYQIPYLGFVMNFLKSIYGIATISINIILIGTAIYINKRGKKRELQEQEINMQVEVKPISV